MTKVVGTVGGGAGCVCVCGRRGGGGGGVGGVIVDEKDQVDCNVYKVHLDDRFAEVLKGLSFSNEVLLNT